MYKRGKIIAVLLAAIVLSFPAPGVTKRSKQSQEAKGEMTGEGPAVLWRDPTDIAARNLYYGPGGEKNQPHGPYTFVKEDLDGSNPKFVVRDRDGVKWKVKLGLEARPETVATRLVWAVGYFANEDYFIPSLRVQGMPPRLHRGQNLIAPDGSIPNVRLKREEKDEKKIAYWRWRDDPFNGTRELNGLKIMMSLVNNWDLKDSNNAVYQAHSEQVYVVSDLGASFGSPGYSWPKRKSRGDLNSYSRSQFIDKVTPEFVDFHVPTRPALLYAVALPQFISRLRLRGTCKQIPRSDAKWMGQMLGRLSPRQIRDAFRAAGYSPLEVEGYSQVVEHRIVELQSL